jgi:hypothetical protein
LLYDLNDKQGALASWEDMLRIDPQAKSNSGVTIRELIDQVKADQTVSK